MISPLRLVASEAPFDQRGSYVLLWMIGARRSSHSFALDHALARADALDVPLLVFEPLRAGYRWASDRLHSFVLQGMADNAAAFARAGVTYLPYVEPEPGAGSGLLAALAEHACLVVTDEQPGFFLPRMVSAASAKLKVRLEVVDGCGIVPLRSPPSAFPTAHGFRRWFHKASHPYLLAFPEAEPFARYRMPAAQVAGATLRRWPMASPQLLAADREALARLPIDHGVAPVATRGGSREGTAALSELVANKLARYGERNHPDAGVESGLSPYLHFGHVGAHQVVSAVLCAQGWDPSRITGRSIGSRNGWWGLPEPVEGFLDQVIIWRELGYGFCSHRADHESWDALPAWAKDTLTEHATDPRPHLYSRAALEDAATGDEVWNAAQRQLLAEGTIHNYLRMLWGKLLLAWHATPQAALATMFELNNKYALDGRDPNSTTGILWTMGLFDRPWPERSIYGTVRYMTSASAKNKLDMTRYLAKFARAEPQLTFSLNSADSTGSSRRSPRA